jgi:chemotaxis protein MotB
MVSFGDMMTLILTFFILLVSLSRERQIGLVARGIGSFVVHLKSYGLNGVLTEQQKLEIHREVRVRFNLPPEEDPEQRVDVSEAETREMVRAEDLARMAPIDDLVQPAIAIFAPGTWELTPEGGRYLELLAPSLRPGPGQILVLETTAGADPVLAKSRAKSVEEHLTRAGIDPARIDVRLWLARPTAAAEGVVDARLVSPARRR